ncbi:solute carrier family 3 member 2a [Nothobranchius furzeri]|uniref:Solute carrier family 3 (Activators of dibasic and neutral amino acid transport), member 2 n=1 Tax=Nothobranchius furzeri TaxID=105023 RepID=A0A1A8AJ81_NOTFU|nr:solute carrier family 3 member 2a [Nothobranchius furzeri]KAF7214794.1 solute carrier family 3 member 2 [Nothobranchius furzeri]
MSKDTEIDMEEVKLNEVDPEKQPMTGDGPPVSEKNGSVKLKVPEDEVTFTGLSKDELMKVAGTPGWVRTRWVLLVLFWLGWVGMLAGAIVIIVQAPRCKPIPEMNWWNEGPLYQIPDLDAFSEGMEGLEAKLDHLTQMKVKGLVLGPFHTVQADEPNTLELTQINPTQGTEKALVSVLAKAHKKGISVVLDLTPNYRGSAPWFTDNNNDIVDKVKAAAEYWMNLGVDGIKVSGFSLASNFTDWPKLQAAVQGNRTEDTKKRALMGVVQGLSATQVSQLVNSTGADLILPDLLTSTGDNVQRIRDVDALHSQQRSVAWGVGASKLERLSKLATSPSLIRLYQLLLFTLPGTPVFTYGDEIGLQAGDGSESPKMIWDLDKEPSKEAPVDEAAEANRTEHIAVRTWFKSLSDLRGKERSLLHGDYYPLSSSASSLAFLRVWDQSERYITAFNLGTQPLELKLSLSSDEVKLPDVAKVKLTTDKELEEDSLVSLASLTLGPEQAVLLQFPYSG